VRIDQKDCGLVRLLSGLSVARPKSGCLESEQIRVRYISRFDPKNAACVKLLAHDRKDATFALAVQCEGPLHRIEDLGRLNELPDVLGVKEKKLSITGHGALLGRLCAMV
jgi:hypothetical protein